MLQFLFSLQFIEKKTTFDNYIFKISKKTTNSIFKFSNDEIIGSLSPVVFDIWSFELCMLMANSSTIVLLPAELAAFPIKIINIFKEYFCQRKHDECKR